MRSSLCCSNGPGVSVKTPQEGAGDRRVFLGFSSSRPGKTARLRLFVGRCLAATLTTVTVLGAVAAVQGCRWSEPGHVVRRTVVFEGITRSYLLFCPPEAKPAPALVFNLHGYGSSAAQQMHYSAMNAVADTAGFIVVYPEAVEARWNSGISDGPGWPTPDVDDVAFISALIDTLHRARGVDLSRVYVCGMSNGGFMSLRIACRLGDRIAAAASVTGVISRRTAGSCTAQRAVPVLLVHGTDDRTVPHDGAPGWLSADATARFWAGLHGAVRGDTASIADSDPSDGSTVVRISYRDSSDEETVVFLKVVGGGHAWPRSGLELPGLGVTNRDISASEEIWRFFRARRMPPSASP
ncbi:dienelactone hydrolase family protein [Candidatus Fermentibacteria bacterium]|nr:dienelactone hydrolase family protein [Candidatus Fermentibacteria bacterium]